MVSMVARASTNTQRAVGGGVHLAPCRLCRHRSGRHRCPGCWPVALQDQPRRHRGSGDHLVPRAPLPPDPELVPPSPAKGHRALRRTVPDGGIRALLKARRIGLDQSSATVPAPMIIAFRPRQPRAPAGCLPQFAARSPDGNDQRHPASSGYPRSGSSRRLQGPPVPWHIAGNIVAAFTAAPPVDPGRPGQRRVVAAMSGCLPASARGRAWPAASASVRAIQVPMRPRL